MVRARRLLPAVLTLTAGCAVLAACTSDPGRPAAADPAATASAAPAGAPSPAASAQPRAVTLVATGDVLLHERLWDQAADDAERTGREPLDFAPMLAGIRPYVSGADLALCHLETPLASPGGPNEGYPSFAAPPQILPALVATGYDACTTASNHSFDQGAAGIDRTLDALDAAGVAHAGTARSRAEAGRTTIVTAGGVKVALLSFTYGFNGGGGDAWRAAVIDDDRITAAARRARERGAEVVVLSLHWGTEYQHEPNRQQLKLARELARVPDIDVIIGHHAHVVEPIERIGDTWVVYGLGNLIAWHGTPVAANAEGMLVRFTFTERPGGADAAGDGGAQFDVTRAEYEPLLVAREPPIRLLDVPVALSTGAYGSSTKARLSTALQRTAEVVTSRGAAADGLTRISP